MQYSIFRREPLGSRSPGVHRSESVGLFRMCTLCLPRGFSRTKFPRQSQTLGLICGLCLSPFFLFFCFQIMGQVSADAPPSPQVTLSQRLLVRSDFFVLKRTAYCAYQTGDVESPPPPESSPLPEKILSHKRVQNLKISRKYIALPCPRRGGGEGMGVPSPRQQ